jgi:hypothetical protein
MMSPPPNLPQPSSHDFANTGSVMTFGAPMMSPPSNSTPRGVLSLSAAVDRRIAASASAARHLSESNARHLEVVNTGREPAFSGSRPAAMNASPGAHSYDQRAFHADMIPVPVRATSDMGPPPRPGPRDMERSSSTGNLSPSDFGGMMGPPPGPRPRDMGPNDFTVNLSLSDMGGMMGPPPRRQRLSGIFPHMAQSPTLQQHFGRGEFADYWPERAVFPDAIRSMGGQGEHLINVGRLPPFGYRPHNMALPSTEGAALYASSSDMGPPPKRQRLAGTFSGARPHTERQYSNGPAEIDCQRDD